MTADRRTVLASLAGASLAPAALARGVAPPRAAVVVDRCETEWRPDAIGIDTRRPRFGWRLAPVDPAARGLTQTGWHVVVSAAEADAAVGAGAIWDSGPRRTAAQAAQPDAMLPIETHRAYWWAVRVADGAGRWSPWSAPERFVTGILDVADWRARWIAARPDTTLPPHRRGQATAAMLPARPLPLLRRVFALPAAPSRAILSVAGLGQYALDLNRRAVGDAALAPAWTDYRRSILYDTYDVTALLHAGRNTLALMLGNGMYNVEHRAGRYTKFLDSFGQPKAILCLTIVDEAGQLHRIVSDAGWRTTDGPIRFSSIYGGEDIDARCEPPGWRDADFDEREWAAAQVVSGPGGTLRASGLAPVRVGRTLPPATTIEVAPGVTLIDFGENFAGRPAIAIAAPAGTTCVVTPGEALDAAGRVSQRSYNAGPGNATQFRFTAAGRGVERFAPRFTYHGFRYVEITGVPAGAIRSVVGEALHADCARVGGFSTSDPALLQIHGLIDRAVTSNLVSVLTDCPHREKLGWLEQTYLNAATVFYNRDGIALYEKMARDIADAQQPDGMVPGIAPEYVAFVDAAGNDQVWRNSPEWGAAAVLAPWEAYRFYGDVAILRAAWPAARRYIAYLAGRAQGGLIDFGMGDWYDIGPADPGPAQLTSRGLTGSAIFHQALTTMARIAPLVGHGGDAAAYRGQAGAVADAINARFLDPVRGSYDRDSQTALAMPLACGIVPPRLRSDVRARLVAAVRRAGDGVTAGDIGFRYVIQALRDAGRDDVILAMLRVTDRPSYGYQIAQGATTLTEAWDANPTKSLNHFMLGHAEGWLYGALAGLEIDHALPGDAALTIAPRALPGIAAAGATHALRAGQVGSAWRVVGDRIEITAIVPAGRSATIVVPTPRAATLREGRRPIALAAGLRSLAVAPDGVTLTVGSGRYRFSASRTA